MNRNIQLRKKSNFWSNLFKTSAERGELEKLFVSMPLFRDFSKKDIDLLLNIVHNRVYCAGEYIFFQGDPGIGLYIILEGEISVEITAGKEKYRMATFSQGDLFGELALLEDEKRSASAIAVKDSRLSVIFKPDLDEFVEKYPRKGITILKGISQIIAGRLRSLNQDYISLYINSPDKKQEV